MQAVWRCKICNSENKMLESSEMRPVIVDDEKLLLTVLHCQNCSEEYIVQIDDDESFELLQKQRLLQYAIGKTKNSFGKPTQRQKRKEKQFSMLLIQHRKALNETYNNSVYWFQNNLKKIRINEPAVYIMQGENGGNKNETEKAD